MPVMVGNWGLPIFVPTKAWIPGVMAGMMVSGASPVYAGIYQFIIVAMILAASGIAGLIVTLLLRARAFSAAAQLTLRPGERQQPPSRLASSMRGLRRPLYPLTWCSGTRRRQQDSFSRIAVGAGGDEA